MGEPTGGSTAATNQSELEITRAEISRLRNQLAVSAAELESKKAVLQHLQESRSWRLTAPLRAITRALKLNTQPTNDVKPAAASMTAETSGTAVTAGAVSLNKDFHSLEEFMEFARANPMYFGDDLEQLIIRHCQVYGIASTAMGMCGPAEVSLAGPECREHLMVRGLNPRQRAVLEELYAFISNRGLNAQNVRIYGHEAITPLALFLRGHFPKYLGTEFARNDVEKAGLFPILHGDICHSEFRSSAFDVIVSCEVLEHVPSIDEALAESARILTPGGRFIGTLPFFYCRKDSHRLATLQDGEVKHLIDSPIYHGNPMDLNGGTLVFEIPGWDLLDRARRAGFAYATMRFVCDQNKGIVATSVGEKLPAKGIFLAIFDK